MVHSVLNFQRCAKIKLTECIEGKQIFATSGTTVVSRGTNRCMDSCNHEEADTRILVHLQDGATTCFVRTVDTDVVVIVASKIHALLTDHPAVDVWIAFGTGKNFIHIHINEICSSLGKDRSMTLPIFHSFTGCDTMSSFYGKGKKSAWEAWKSYPDVTQAFLHVARFPHSTLTMEAENFQLLERFTVILYDRTSSLKSINEARRELFCQRSKTMETIPPTQDTLLQHCKHVAYQAGIWTTSNLVEQQTPSPEENGWTLAEETKSWRPVWTTLPVASKGCGARCFFNKAN